MNRFASFNAIYFLLLVATISVGNALAGPTSAFAGHWVLRIGNRALIVVTLKSTTGAKGIEGWLARPKHFKSSGTGEFFSDISGRVIRYPIIQSNRSGGCLAFTIQNPSNKSDTDHFRLCLGAPGHATLGINLPTFEPWPVMREKGPIKIPTDWNSSRTYILGETDVPNAEMLRIFDADQKDRQAPFGKINWAVVNKRDSARRKLVRQLLAEGKLHTGKDFERAAFIFQHGGTPDDYLLAHTLAMVAIARGDVEAIWISAATLDRYLHAIHQPQIFGTQFNFKPDGRETQEPYNRQLISDALRRDLGVPSQAEQKVQEKEFERSSRK